MKFKSALIIVLFLSISLLPACQKAQEQPKPKAVAAQAVKQMPQPQPQQVQPVKEITSQQVKFRQFTSTEKTVPLTESEQKYVDEIHGRIVAPDVQFKGKNVLRYLKILVKGNPKTIRWYINHPESEEAQKEDYGGAIASAFEELDLNKSKEAYSLALEVLKTKKDYPEALAGAVSALGKTGNQGAIPPIREIAKSPDEGLQLIAVGALLKLGDGDTALPILDRLATKGYPLAIRLLVSKSGVLYDKRGKAILVKALSNPRAEVTMMAAMSLYRMGLDKGKCEEAALNIMKTHLYKKNEDYGFKMLGGNPSNLKLLPSYKNRNLKELAQNFYSDMRACSYAAWLLGELKSKKAIPMLEYMEKNNTGVGFVCWENAADRAAGNALDKIRGGHK